MKRRKIICLIILLLAITLAGVFYYLGLERKNSFFFQKPFLVPMAREKRLRISGGEEPLRFFNEILISPKTARVGQLQKFSIWVKNSAGEVKKVIAKIETEKGVKEILLKLKEGSSIRGRWEGFWQVDDIIPGKLYLVEFVAIDSNQRKISLTTSFYGR